MAEDLSIIQGSKTEQYEQLLPQILAIIEGETNLTANLANIAAALKEQFRWWWVGFYLVDSPEDLVLGPFQGKVACVRIPFGRGVCGAAAASGETQRVEDVHAFAGHIACDSASNSELVVPLFKDGRLLGVLDLDSPRLARFSAEDQAGIERLAQVFIELTDC